jgi:putative oxidoreductase
MTREHKIYQLAYWIASFVVAAVLLSGYQKIFFPADFAVSVYRFHLLPGFLVNLAALYLPWLELVCAVCLLFIPRYRSAALWIVLILLAGFTAAIGINLWRGSVFGCGCFGRGAADEPMNWLSLLRNTGLISLVVLALVARRKM